MQLFFKEYKRTFKNLFKNPFFYLLVLSILMGSAYAWLGKVIAILVTILVLPVLAVAYVCIMAGLEKKPKRESES